MGKQRLETYLPILDKLYEQLSRRLEAFSKISFLLRLLVDFPLREDSEIKAAQTFTEHYPEDIAFEFSDEMRVADSKILQLAPSVEHQAEAMLSILRRYSWHSFAVITTQIGGHEDFVRAIRDLMQKTLYHEFKFTIVKIVTLKETERILIRSEMEDLADSEARIILLFASRQEAFEIMAAARDLGLTGKHYVWIAAQSVVGTQLDTPPGHFPPGMLGVYFNTTINRLHDELERAVTVFAHGLELFVNDHRNSNINLLPNLTCNGTGQTRWNKGDLLFKYLRNVSASVKQGPNISFNMDGSLKYVELQVLNLNNKGVWEKIGVWTDTGLDIKILSGQEEAQYRHLVCQKNLI
ncbi:glutamate receptor ionotropic, NMDA 2B [Trichonephila clavata]|uniref:Glutamate receptor ionotropic, NMDA 2B n=1 Tax=Trichonephila clavata TaxID=2740835 RepID=A0A8X6JGN2_TRICU|nr:glutamate receptor ionotropic, NMDA 2B [Trichonephila clavata]